MNTVDRRAFLTGLFDAAVSAADPEKVLPRYLPDRPPGRTVVVGAGKGSAQMAQVFEQLWDGPLTGVVVTRYGFGVPCERIEILEASHPVPDDNGLRAAAKIRKAVSGLTSNDLVVALISGGGSALLPAPAANLTLEDEIAVNKALLASGAPISLMNAIRKHMSTIKGGRLAALASPARVVSLVVSDIPGDNPADVASGPTVPGKSTRNDALAAIDRYRIPMPPEALAWLRSTGADAPRPDDAVFARNEVHVIASAGTSLAAAASACSDIECVILSDAIEGEAREAGGFHGALAREVALRQQPFAKPVVMLSGGETTVTLRGNGKGGRNSEFLLAFALAIDGLDGITALAADTDGIDGSETNAGAFADGGSIARMREAGLDPAKLLAGNDAWSAFHAVGDLFEPGPTGTNVNDFRAIRIE